MDKTPSHSNRIRLECTRYYNRRLLPQTRRRRQQLATSAGGSSRDEEPIDITAFTTSVENILSAYLNRNASIEYHPGLVQLVAPVSIPPASFCGRSLCAIPRHTVHLDTQDRSGHVLLLRTVDVNLRCAQTGVGLEKAGQSLRPAATLVRLIHAEDYTSSHPLSARMSHFLALLRQFLPDLHAYFEEEAVDMRELAHAWLEGLFAKEMQIGMLMRVWGTFRLRFSVHFDSHFLARSLELTRDGA